MFGLGLGKCGAMKPPRVLTPLQAAFLDVFFQQPAGQDFFLTGGTALAEFYLHHRYSQDVDLFTLNEETFDLVSASIPGIAAYLRAEFTEQVRTLTFRQVFIRVAGQADLKIDFVRDVGPQFGEHQRFDNIIVDSEFNIAVNKVTALFGRAAMKDFVDLYFLLKQEYDLDQLIALAKEKDPGFSEFYFANMLRHHQRVTSLPQLLKPLTLEEFHAFFEALARQVMLKAKPPQ